MNIFKKIGSFFKKPAFKRVVVAIGGAAVNAGAMGVFGPKAAAAAAIIGALTAGGALEIEKPKAEVPSEVPAPESK